MQNPVEMSTPPVRTDAIELIVIAYLVVSVVVALLLAVVLVAIKWWIDAPLRDADDPERGGIDQPWGDQ
jgi:hypothetical protein